ncbi:hypothetical protein SOVF_021300 [Spinacia oleracea]|uniref:Inactive protein RESTRICTED TEV MOVEMENT 2 n=1 Tax=Spinacia oleracea TaxID=3562 RepID=A0A9R0IKF6_SPIOL|nr:inactive protein RESTRICTED TEV MOVEMENT 2-like [Spinacia oleracea]KNA23798.1 hypothetical protein SOVF_021300 [Spinacia oleracea]
MADFRRRNWVMRPKTPMAPRLIDEQIIPSSGWTDFSEFHCLLVDLPGFKKDDIKLNVDESGTIVVKGRRKIGEEKQVHFEKTFDVPEDGDIKSVSMVFDGDTLRVSVPKVAKTEKIKPNDDLGASSRNINEKDAEEYSPPALSSSSDNKPEEFKTLASANSITNEKPEEYQKEQMTEKQDEVQKEQMTEKQDQVEKDKNDCDQGKEKESESPTEENTEKKNECQRKQNDQGKEKEPESPVEENTEKPNECQKEQNDQGEKKESSKTSVMGKIIENKGILIASIISFTLGVLLSNKIHPSSPPK